MQNDRVCDLDFSVNRAFEPGHFNVPARRAPFPGSFRYPTHPQRAAEAIGRARIAWRERASRLGSGLRRSAGSAPAAFFRPAARPRPNHPALAAVFAAALSLPLAAGAQDTIELVSNMNQPASSGVSPVPPQPGAVAGSYAQGFTTGSNTNGYTLTSIELNLIGGADKQFRLELATGVSTSVGSYTPIAELTPESLGAGIKTFNAPANTVLSPDTEYFLVMTTTRATADKFTTFVIARHDATGEDEGAQPGWSVADHQFKRGPGLSTNNWVIPDADFK